MVNSQRIIRNSEMDGHTQSFPALRGIQAGREYYTTLFPLRLVPKLFLFDEEELAPELRAQRTLNRSRIPEISRYLVDNPSEYVFSSITASIDGEVRFEPYSEKGYGRNIGRLTIPMDAQLLINDGQHRRAAIEEALKEKPELGFEGISVVLFVDTGLQRSQQMFSDLNKHAVRPTRSLGILYDHRDPMAQLSLKLVNEIPIFKGLTELEKTTISNRSTKLFTLSGIYQATRVLLGKRGKKTRITKKDEALAINYWTALSKHIPEWQLLLERKVHSYELRRDYIHAHGVALHALTIVGVALIDCYPNDWEERLKPLSELDWSRSNRKLWEGRAMIGGRISKAQNNIVLTANVLKKYLTLPLALADKKVEEAFQKGAE